MEERLTERSRRVMHLAHEEASRLHHEYLGTEHILLGIARESTGLTAEVLRSFNVTLDFVRSEVERIIGIGPDAGGPDDRGASARAKRVLEFALDEASQCGRPLVDAEHLFLGITQEIGGVAAQVLRDLGADPAAVRERVLALLDQRDAES